MTRSPHYPVGAGVKGPRGGAGEISAAMTYPKLAGRRGAVYAALEDGPATSEEISEKIRLHWYLVRPRMSDLQAVGPVTKTGARGRGAMGGVSSQWRLTTDEERAIFHARRAATAEKAGGE